MSSTLAAIEERAEEIAALGPENERLGKLTDAAAKLLRETGAIRMLQPAEHGGAEAHPREFAETVMRLASLDGSTGWVAGIVGVHPWEMALCDPRVQQEIWGARPGDLDRLAVRTDGRAASGRRRLRLQRALAVLLRHRPLRLDLPRCVPRRRGR